MAIPNPNPNIADGLKCDNKTYSSNKIESLIKVATELPIPEEGDAGKVLTVNDELGYDLETAPGDRLPETALDDAGKVVAVNDTGDAYELKTPVAPTSIIDDSAASASTVYSSSKVDTLLSGKADSSSLPDIKVLSATATINIGATVTLANFTFNVPTGYTIINAYDDSYIGNIIASVIRINTGDGSKQVHLNYVGISQSYTDKEVTCKAVCAKNVTYV